MLIGLIDVDGHNFPNLALMKISRYYKAMGASVDWYTPFGTYDIVYMSKVFTFTPDYLQCITNADKIEKGGTGFKDYETTLPLEIDRLQPDYSIYNVDKKSAYGFLTRGCVRNCKWCIVPKKEGKLRPYMDIEEIAIEGRNKITLMDNNVLASDYGLEQIEKIVKLKLSVDFNQSLDARLVTPEIADLLVKVRWIDYIRFACDTSAQIPHLLKAIEMLTARGYNKKVFVQVLLDGDINECYERIMLLRNYKGATISPFAQPYIDFDGKREPPQWQKDMARWCNLKQIFRSVGFKDYKPRTNFLAKEYFKK